MTDHRFWSRTSSESNPTARESDRRYDEPDSSRHSWQPNREGRTLMGAPNWPSSYERDDFRLERNFSNGQFGRNDKWSQAPFDRPSRFDRQDRFSDFSTPDHRERLSTRIGESFMEYVNKTLVSNEGKGPKGYQRSDERIFEEICEGLYRHPAIDASHIEVHVENGVVKLSGTVENRSMKRLAEDVAESILGVKDTSNLIRILPESSLFPVPDKAKAEAAGPKAKSPIP